MMSPFRFPYQAFPYNYSYYRPKAYMRKCSTNCCNNNVSLNSKNENKTQTCYDSINQNSSSSKNDDDFFFEIFGLKLYFDDVLLICLIFFLYQEGVQDQELFICLILLLLS